MLNKLFGTVISLCLLSTTAQAGEGSFTILDPGQPAPFHSVCFDDLATAKILTWKEFIHEEFVLENKLETDKLIAHHQLEMDDLNLTLKNLQERYDFDVVQREKELKSLRGIVKRGKRVNVPVAVATGIIGGFALGFGTLYLVENKVN